MATLGAILAAADMHVSYLHGSLQMPLDPTPSSPARRLLLDSCGGWSFVPVLYDGVDRDVIADRAVARMLHALSLERTRDPTGFARLPGRDRLVASVHRDMERAEHCIDRCLDYVAHVSPHVVALSCTFEQQLVAGLALARHIKARAPEIRIIMGGSACFGDPAAELMRNFPALDAVCHGEGDDVVVPLVSALVAGEPLGHVPTIAYRTPNGEVATTPAAPLLRDLDRLPIPDYRSFVEQYAASDWSHRRAPDLWFETSRGCWWGQKHLCTFCGFNADRLTYRRKSLDRAFHEITALHETYPTAARLSGADNILDMEYVNRLNPRLEHYRARSERPLRMFWQVKSNLRREQVFGLARAGCESILPGVESLSDGVLNLMDKGSTGLGNVALIRWCAEAGVHPAYNIIIRLPTETAAQYREMAALVPFLHQLMPPRVVTLALDRFSPFWATPERFGIQNMRVAEHYELLFQGSPNMDLTRMAYTYAYEHDGFDDDELQAAWGEFNRAVGQWVRTYRPGLAEQVSAGATLRVKDHRNIFGQRTEHVLAGRARELVDAIDRPRARPGLGRSLSWLDSDILDSALDTFEHRRWLARDTPGRVLWVIPSAPTAAESPPVDAIQDNC